MSGGDPNRPIARELERGVGDFELGAVGDCIISRPIGHMPRFAPTLAALAGCDALFGNVETVIFDPRGFAGAPHPFASDWTLASPPSVAADMAAMGINLGGRANNHALDWGLEGMRETGEWLDDAGIAHAGAGETAGAARAPGYLETPAGRVAVVSCVTTFRETSEASPEQGAAPGRPGVAGIHLTRFARLPAGAFDLARQLEAELGADLAGDDPGPSRLLNQRFEASAEPTPSYRYEMDPGDLAETLRGVRLGKQHSDLLVAALHAHEPLHDRFPQPPGEFVGEFGRAAIDAGADVVVTTGIHHLAGVELYNGGVIFHGLGNFVFSDMIEPLPHELYVYGREQLARTHERPELATDADLSNAISGEWFANPETFQGAIARCRWHDGELTRIELIPLDLGYGTTLTTSGVPAPAGPEVATVIVERLRALSAPLGTTVVAEPRNGTVVGVIDLTGAA